MPAKKRNLRRSPRLSAAKITNRKTYLYRSANDNNNYENDLHGTRRAEATGLNNVKRRVTWDSVEVFSIYGVGDPTSLVFQQKVKL